MLPHPGCEQYRPLLLGSSTIPFGSSSSIAPGRGETGHIHCSSEVNVVMVCIHGIWVDPLGGKALPRLAAGDRHLTRAPRGYGTHWIWIDFGDEWIPKTIKLLHGIGACSRLMPAAAM